MAQVVQPDARKTSPGSDLVEVPVQGAGFEWRADLRAEHQVVVSLPEVVAAFSPAYAVRVADAFESGVSVRVHDRTRLLDL